MINLNYKRFFTAFLAVILFLSSASIFASAVPAESEPQDDGVSAETAEDTAEGDSGDAASEEEEEEESRPRIDVYDQAFGYPPVDNYAVDGTAAMLYDLNSDTVIYTQNPTDKVYPASLTKLMTAMIIAENGDLTDTVTVTANAVNSVEARTGDLMIGEQLTLHDLLYCILVASSNEAAVTGAEHISGSSSEFVELMNAKAAELGCTGTHFANPHGLHDDDHYTTVNDLLLITKAVLENELLREICYSTTYEMPETNMQEARTIHTTNYLASNELSHKYYYSLAKGVKTGYTGKAGRCLITTAEKGNLNLLVIVTGCRTVEAENNELIMHSFTEAKKLFEYGFANYEFTTVLSPLVPIAEVPVSGGENASVVVAPVEESSIVLPIGYDPNEVTTEVTLSGGTSVQAPFEAGKVVGTATVYYQNKPIRSAEITPITSMDAAGTSTQTDSASNTPATPEDVSGNAGISIWTILLILAGGFLIFYAASYIYNNMTRRKPVNSGKKRSARTSGTASARKNDNSPPSGRKRKQQQTMRTKRR